MIKIIIYLHLILFNTCALSCDFNKKLLVVEKNIIKDTLKSLLSYEKPNLPKSPYFKDIKQGCIKVSFDIDDTGNTTNIHILSSNPARVFDRVIVKSVNKLKFLQRPNNKMKESILIYRYDSEFGLYIW